jgi:predicted transposase
MMRMRFFAAWFSGLLTNNSRKWASCLIGSTSWSCSKETHGFSHGGIGVVENGERSHFNSISYLSLSMLLTLKVKLQPSATQREKLLRTMETFNHACDTISKTAYESRTFNQYRLHHKLYYRIREQHHLPA